MTFKIIPKILNESKVFNALADELLDINILANSKGVNIDTQFRQKIKDLFKELHSTSPDLTRIHSDIEQIKSELGGKADANVERHETPDGGTQLSPKEKDIVEELLDLNIKLSRAGRAKEFRDELKQLKGKIGKVGNDEILTRIREIEASL